MKNYTLHLIKHGATLGNEQGKYIGKTDEPLSKEGKDEIKEVCEYLHYPAAEIVYSSPLKRCIETAEIIYPNTFIKTVDNIMEYDFGVFENKSMEELKNDSDFKQWAENGMIGAPKGGEEKAEFDIRVQKGLSEILSDMMKNKITSAAVITHGGVIMSWLAKYGLPQKDPMYWAVKNGCGYTVTTSSYLWGAGETFEIMDRLPIDLSSTNSDLGYEAYDINEESDSFWMDAQD